MMNRYFWAMEGDELATELGERVRTFQEQALRIGLTNVWAKNRAFYEGRHFGNSMDVDIIDAGDVGELKALTFNHFRNILRHIINQLSAQIPAYEVSARNSNLKSQRAARIGKDIIKYYYKVRRLSKHMHRTLERAVVYGDGYLLTEFEPGAGRMIRTDKQGKLIREGDFAFESISPLDVFYDFTKDSFDKWEWVTFRRKRNKYELADLFPDKADAIVGLRPFYEDDVYRTRLDFNWNYNTDTDDVYVYSSYHRAGTLFDRGKYVMYAGEKQRGIMLFEGDNLYRERFPIFKLSPGEYLETSYGYTEANTIRSPQMVLNKVISDVVSNANNFGTSNIWHPPGNTPTVEEITSGMNLITSDVKPEVVSFYQENPGMYELLKLCVGTMETLSGQNAVVRGNVQDTPNLKSGVALAAVIQQAVAYSQAFEAGYHALFEDVNTFILETLRDTATEERLYEISGSGMSAAVKSFVGSDLEGVTRVFVDRINPIMQTPSGQIEIAMQLAEGGIITKEEFLGVVRSGNLDIGTQNKDRMRDYVESIKERLLSGERLEPIPGIDHQYVVGQVQSLLYDVDMVQNPENREIVQNIAYLVNGHMQLVRNGDELSSLIFAGQQPQPMQISADELGGMAPPVNQSPASASGPPAPATGQGRTV